MYKRLLLTTTVLTLTAGGAAQAQAPAQSSGPQQSGNTVAEVVVTAEKREESLQDVPVAISAFTSEKRDLVGITTIQDMTNFTPGLQYSSQTDRTSLRGVGRLTNVRTAEGGVAIYSDGVYTTSTVEAGKSPLFVDRVEVLRGPQGTLYGRNSISGAINVISKRPTEDWYAEIRGQYGNYDRRLIEGAVSGPTPIDGLTFRLAMNWEKQDEGWYDNVVPGKPDEGNVIDTKIFEGQLQWEVNDRLDIWTKFSSIWWDNDGGGPGARNSWTPTEYPTYQYQNAGITLNPGYACRPGTGVTNVVNASPLGCRNPELDDERTFASNIPYDVYLTDTYIFATEVNYRFDTFDLKYVGGAVNYHYYLTGPVFFGGGTSPPISQYTLPTVLGTPGLTAFTNYGFLYEEDINWQSHEINLASNTDSNFRWLAGIYYFDEDDEQPVSTQLFDQPEAQLTPSPGPFGAIYCAQTNGVCAPNTPGRIYDSRTDSHIESKAIYGQIDWDFIPDWRLTVGLRYTDDTKKGREEVRVNCYAAAACFAAPELLPFLGTGGFYPLVDVTQFPTVTAQPGAGNLPPGVLGQTTFDPATGRAVRNFKADWQATTGTLGIQWEPDSDTNVYARYSRGFKAGGYRVGIDTAIGRSPLSDAENGDNFEIGLKKTFLDGTLQVNTALFRLQYENAQIPLSIVSTAGGLSTSQAVLFNVDEAVSQGLEFEATWLPADNLQILFNYSYLDTEITEGATVDPADPSAVAPGADPLLTFAECGQVVPGPQRIPPSDTAGPRCEVDVFTSTPTSTSYQRFQSLEGNHLPNAPEHKIALNGNYTYQTEWGDLIGSITYIWRDEQYGSMFDREYYKSPAYDQVDARLTFRDKDDRFTVILYGRNLLDDIGYEGGAFAVRKAGFIPTGAFATTTPIVEGIASIYPLTPPRTFGIELQYRFF
jgi:iron complex outermembrane recepter protein